MDNVLTSIGAIFIGIGLVIVGVLVIIGVAERLDIP